MLLCTTFFFSSFRKWYLYMGILSHYGLHSNIMSQLTSDPLNLLRLHCESGHGQRQSQTVASATGDMLSCGSCSVSPWSLSTHTKSWISRAEESCSAHVRIAFEPLECNTVPNCHSIAESFNSSGWMSFNLGQALLIQTGNTASFPESPALYQLSHFRLVIVSPSTPPPPSPSLRETSDC